MGEKLASAKLIAQYLQSLHRILVGRAERFFGGRGRDLQLLIIIPVEGIESVGVVGNHAQQADSLGTCHFFGRQHIGKQSDGSFQLFQLLGFRTAIDNIPLDQVLLQHAVRPNAELGSIF